MFKKLLITTFTLVTLTLFPMLITKGVKATEEQKSSQTPTQQTISTTPKAECVDKEIAYANQFYWCYDMAVGSSFHLINDSGASFGYLQNRYTWTSTPSSLALHQVDLLSANDVNTAGFKLFDTQANLNLIMGYDDWANVHVAFQAGNVISPIEYVSGDKFVVKPLSSGKVRVGANINNAKVWLENGTNDKIDGFPAAYWGGGNDIGISFIDNGGTTATNFTATVTASGSIINVNYNITGGTAGQTKIQYAIAPKGFQENINNTLNWYEVLDTVVGQNGSFTIDTIYNGSGEKGEYGYRQTLTAGAEYDVYLRTNYYGTNGYTEQKYTVTVGEFSGSTISNVEYYYDATNVTFEFDLAKGKTSPEVAQVEFMIGNSENVAIPDFTWRGVSNVTYGINQKLTIPITSFKVGVQYNIGFRADRLSSNVVTTSFVITQSQISNFQYDLVKTNEVKITFNYSTREATPGKVEYAYLAKGSKSVNATAEQTWYLVNNLVIGKNEVTITGLKAETDYIMQFRLDGGKPLTVTQDFSTKISKDPNPATKVSAMNIGMILGITFGILLGIPLIWWGVWYFINRRNGGTSINPFNKEQPIDWLFRKQDSKLKVSNIGDHKDDKPSLDSKLADNKPKVDKK